VKIVEENGRRYAIRNGQRIEVETTYNTVKPKRRRREKFKADFVKFPETWREALRGSSGTVYDLAHAIIVEAYKCEVIGGEVKLSAVKMRKATRAKAAKELVELGLIQLHRDGCKSYQVALVLPAGFSLKGK
jgi:hypothetical protein